MNLRQVGPIFDALATLLVMLAVWTGTPLGGSVIRLIQKPLGTAEVRLPLSSYFDTRPDRIMTWAVDPGLIEDTVRAESREDASAARLAHKTRISPSLARAFSVVASGGRVALDPSREPWYDIRALEHHAADRTELGIETRVAGSMAVLDHGLQHRLQESLHLLEAYLSSLGGEDAALAAWAIGLPLVQRAVEKARSLDKPNAADSLDVFGVFLTRNDRDRARAFVSPVHALKVAYEMQWPLSRAYPITSPFGMRPHPIHGRRRLHAGVDLGAPNGTSIKSAADGLVVHTGDSKTRGLHVLLDHGHGLWTSYLHASVVHVAKGDRVRAGQIIGQVGSTGASTGPHLHYGVYVEGQPVDPLVFRPPGMDVSFEIRGPATPPPRGNLGRN